MSGHALALLAAVAVAAAFTFAPAAAGERATLKVTARVVDRCTVAVPPRVPPGLWRDGWHQPWRFVRHECVGKPPFWLDARPVPAWQLRERLLAQVQPGGRVHEMRHPSRDDVVLITISY